ncbi:hypothetical protein VM98_34700, partial [Streptomyces rubellomurinus subsp. indigoferus]
MSFSASRALYHYGGVSQVHGALGAGGWRLEQCQVGGLGAGVEELLADAERDRVHPQVEAVEEPVPQQGLHQVQAAD